MACSEKNLRGEPAATRRESLSCVLLLMLSVVCCSREPNDELVFHIDDTLLGDPYSNETLGITFRAPVGWSAMPESGLAEIQSRLSGKLNIDEQIRIEPVQFFLDQKAGCCCCLSWLKGPGEGPFSPLLLGRYREVLAQKFPEAQIKEAQFRWRTFRLVQYLVIEKETVSLKLVGFGRKDEGFQLDYIVPAKAYHQNAKMIESSIGSLEAARERR